MADAHRRRDRRADRRPPAARPSTGRASGSAGRHHDRLAAIAAVDRGGPLARYDETLTGFKWIVRAGDGAGTGLVFGYEEALGLCVDPDLVRDKDGISAAVVACDLAATLRGAGRTLPDRLDELARTHGLFTHRPTLRPGRGPGQIAGAMRRSAPHPPSYSAIRSPR